MFVPSQGFRHAATLLLSNSARAVPAGASPDVTRMLLERLAHHLVALAEDTRAPAGAADWLTAEFNATIDRLPQAFDREATKSAGAAILASVASRRSDSVTRDICLIYVPEDRLPVAGLLAVELTKRRVSVALAEYEVATAQALAAAVRHGLSRHRGVVVLSTKELERRQWQMPDQNDRLRVLHDPELRSTVDDLTRWANQLNREPKPST